MLGKAPSDEEKKALIAYLSTLPSPPNPFLEQGEFSEAAKRGKLVFESSRAACVDCHSGPYLTDGMIHDVGSGSPQDHYQGYNTPSLRGVHRKLRLLHSGRAKSLHRVVTDLHSPEKVNGEGKLTEQQTSDLIEYLKSL
jgi:cytochrome c peroxidase